MSVKGFTLKIQVNRKYVWQYTGHMEFINPFSATCESCQHQAAYPVADLLAYSARCHSCGVILKSTGLKMNESLRKHRIETWPLLFLWEGFDIFEMDIDLISDEDLEAIQTPGEFIDIALKTGANTGNIEARIASMDIMSSVKYDVNTLLSKTLVDLANESNPVPGR